MYLWITSKWEWRRVIFLYIRAASRSNGLMASLCSILMVLLHGNELGNFTLTNIYIVIENPILLCWAELSKYSAHLIAAVDKYQSLGEDAPYCKLLYSSKDLPEFNRNALRIYATIARKIAIHEGQDTLKNYAGTEESLALQPMIDKAIMLVKVAGGANTLTTASIRQSYLAPGPENEPIRNDLRFGAHIKEMEDEGAECGSDQSNIGN